MRTPGNCHLTALALLLGISAAGHAQAQPSSLTGNQPASAATAQLQAGLRD